MKANTLQPFFLSTSILHILSAYSKYSLWNTEIDQCFLLYRRMTFHNIYVSDKRRVEGTKDSSGSWEQNKGSFSFIESLTPAWLQETKKAEDESKGANRIQKWLGNDSAKKISNVFLCAFSSRAPREFRAFFSFPRWERKRLTDLWVANKNKNDSLFQQRKNSS